MNINKTSSATAMNLYQKPTNKVSPTKEENIKTEKSKVITKSTEEVVANNRANKVSEIKEQIKNGTFKINPEAIAEKMLQDKDMVKNLYS